MLEDPCRLCGMLVPGLGHGVRQAEKTQDVGIAVEIAIVPLGHPGVGGEGEGFLFLGGQSLFGLIDNPFGLGKRGSPALACPNGRLLKVWLHGGKGYGTYHGLRLYLVEKQEKIEVPCAGLIFF
jgi:hypothetical protein